MTTDTETDTSTIFDIEIEDAEFVKQIEEDCSQLYEEFLMIKCKTCKKKYSLGKCKYSAGDPICPHCGN